MEDYENVREIPGLPESGKKGKKKSNNTKKTFTLQTFLHDDESTSSGAGRGGKINSVDEDPMESHFTKLNLDEEELVIMESCHSFIHDMLKHMGPANVMDPRLQQELSNFPPEAKRIIQKCGGYRNFILRSKDLAVVDRMISAREDLKLAQELALKEISSTRQQLKNENVHSPVTTKEVWNSKPNVLETRPTSETSSEASVHGDMKSFMNESNANGNSLYYKSSNKENSSNHGVRNESKSKVERNLLIKQVEQLDDEKRVLIEINADLNRRLLEKEKLSESFQTLKSKYSKLELLCTNTRNELELSHSELEKNQRELGALHAAVNSDSDKQIIFTLQKKLETERLKNLNLSKELEMLKSGSISYGANLLTNQPSDQNTNTVLRSSGGWEHSLTPMTLASESDPLGIRSIFTSDSGIGQGTGIHTPGTSGVDPWAVSAVNIHPSLGTNKLSGGWLGEVGEGRSRQSPVSLMSQMSQPPPPLGLAPRSLSPPSGPVTPPSTSVSPPVLTGKAARQELLVKKLAALLPGIQEEAIKGSITELRAKHGKLSGWPTTRIASGIMELINESNFKSSFNT